MLQRTMEIDWYDLTFRVVRGLAVVWLCIFAIAYFGQRKLLYPGSSLSVQPAEVGLAHVLAGTLRVGTTSAPVDLVVWRAKAKVGQPTVLYFHGNGGAIAHRHSAYAQLLAEGWGLYAMSYRGYSGASGQPSEPANVADALAAYDALRADGVAAGDIVLFGESLGSGVAVQVAAQRPVRAVVLESPYSSVVDVAKHRFPYLPVDWAIRDRYDSIRHGQRVTAPVLILAGMRDGVIPIELSRKLAAALPGPIRIVEYPRGGHIDLLVLGGLSEMRAWVKTAKHEP